MDEFESSQLLAAVDHAFGRTDIDPAWTRRPVGHQVDNMTTHALDRVAGTFRDGSAWSFVVKTLHPASESAIFATIPPEHHATTLVALNWLDEPRVYRCGLAGALPGSLRMPVLHHIEETCNRISMWLDDVADTSPWDRDRYHRTAVALGRLSGAWTAAEATATFDLRPREIGDLFYGKVTHFDLAVQSDDGFWSQPHVSASVRPDHRTRLFALAEQMPQMLGRLPTLPRGVCHGDASTANFLEPGDGSIVAIDWAFGTVDAIGSDLAQLLAGRCDDGSLPPDEVRPTADVLFEGFSEGLHLEGVAVPSEQIQFACATHLAARSVFPALMVEPNEAGVVDMRRVHSRVALAELGLELAARHASHDD